MLPTGCKFEVSLGWPGNPFTVWPQLPPLSTSCPAPGNPILHNYLLITPLLGPCAHSALCPEHSSLCHTLNSVQRAVSLGMVQVPSKSQPRLCIPTACCTDPCFTTGHGIFVSVNIYSGSTTGQGTALATCRLTHNSGGITPPRSLPRSRPPHTAHFLESRRKEPVSHVRCAKAPSGTWHSKDPQEMFFPFLRSCLSNARSLGLGAWEA